MTGTRLPDDKRAVKVENRRRFGRRFCMDSPVDFSSRIHARIDVLTESRRESMSRLRSRNTGRIAILVFSESSRCCLSPYTEGEYDHPRIRKSVKNLFSNFCPCFETLPSPVITRNLQYKQKSYENLIHIQNLPSKQNSRISTGYQFHFDKDGESN
jgi:hypothetical protein